MIPVYIVVPTWPLVLIAAAVVVRAVASVNQVKELKKLREVVESNLGPVTVKDPD